MSIWHTRLLEVVEELKVGTTVEVRRRFYEKFGNKLAAYDLTIINGEPHWHRKLLWARNDLVKEGKLVMDGDKLKIPKPSFPMYPFVFSGLELNVRYITIVVALIFIFILILNGGK